jgi:hypothetical protein
MDRLTKAQNTIGVRANIDIMTYAGLCETREQLEAHVVSCEEQAAEYSRRR